MKELYQHLLEAYKKHRQTVAFDDKNAYEIYKWQLITATQGMSPIEIVRAHVNNSNKPEKGGFWNLIDATRDNSVLKDLVNNQPLELENALNKLVDENIPLNDRLSEFKTTMTKLLQGTNFNCKANDERTAATILTCFNPQKYTIYKDSVYRKLCAYLSVPTEKPGKKYQHYLELIRPLAEMISQDSELKAIIKNSAIANLLQSDLLMAQDVCWEIVDDDSKIINCWLITWNPQYWGWDNYEEWAKGTKNGNSYSVDWTCNSKQPKIGDQVFLMKLGTEPRGIIAHGVVSKPSYDAPHYDGDKAAAGVTTPHINVEFDDIRDYRTESILQTDTLNRIFPEQTWTPQSSGIKIKCNVNELLKLWNELKLKLNNSNMNDYITLLEKTHNLILTGAPGTGKTYLAKQMAKAMGCSDNEIGFVQFHPSYDYSDFVEGLRPMQDDNGSVGFERKDGVFKAFCAKALEKFDTNTFDVSFDKLLMSIGDGEKKDLYTPSGKKFSITPNTKGNLKLITGTDSKENGVLTKERIKAEFLGTPIDKWWKGYYCGVVNCLKEEFNLKTVSINTNRPFVFIIDEINRGEISKIFGELFFSIDPGYRGKDGMVETQYQHMIEDGDTFKKGFFVPENVYIIGTMNDIDRSVESMDFAFRRRFAFKEVTAQESQNMLDSDEAWKGKKPDETTIQIVKGKMDSLNKMIWHKPTDGEQEEDKSVDGLSAAYHIGASYFLKLANYKNADGSFDFDQLWEYHLEGLLFEYLRGTTDIYKKIKKLAKAYGYTNADKYE